MFAALVGSYPFSNVDLAAVTVETLENPGRYAGSYRSAVVDAPVEPHVVNAALRPRSEAHLVAIRSVPFPFEAARKYFLEGLAEPKADHLRRRLADFIVGMSDVAPAFLEQVRDRVHRATRDPERQNPARRTLYDWAKPWPEARLVWDVLEATLQPAAERPDPAVQVIIVEIIDLLAGPTAEAIRSDIISAMVTIWVAASQHRIVAARLSSMLDGVPGLAETPRQRRRLGFWAACHGIIRHSAAELLRRGCLGDHHHVGQVGLGPEVFDPKLGSPGRRTSGAPKARATGLPVPTLDLSAAASAGSNRQFLRNVASACRPWLMPYRTSCDGT